MSGARPDATVTLFGAPTGNCRRVAIAFEEAQVPYVAKRLDLFRGDQRDPEYLRLNPRGKVPLIVCPGPGGPTTMAESNAILCWLAEQSPGQLLPVEPAARALALERFFYVLTEVIAPNHAAFRLPETEKAARDLLDQRAKTALLRCETLLESEPFIAGDAFSLADIAAFTVAQAIGADFAAEICPALLRWYAQTAERPAVQRGLAAFNHLSQDRLLTMKELETLKHNEG